MAYPWLGGCHLAYRQDTWHGVQRDTWIGGFHLAYNKTHGMALNVARGLADAADAAARLLANYVCCSMPWRAMSAGLGPRRACAQHIAMKRVIERNKKVEAVSAISPEKRIFFPFIIVQTRY